MEIVKQWLKDNAIYYDELDFSIGDKTKSIIDNKIDVMIDDNPRNIESIAKLIPVICYDARSNKMCKGHNIIRCFSWYDIYNTIKELRENK